VEREYYGGIRYGCNDPVVKTKQPPNYTFRMAKVMGKNRLAAGRIRLRYLTEEIWSLVPSKHPIVVFWANEMLSEAYYLIKNMRFEPRETTGIDTISEADIQSAKQYPISQLIDFSRGPAIAWCHEDRRPSLAWLKRINKAKCYPCNKMFDPIDVLTERDGMSFIEAVKELRS
jgi:hypothetical protein